MAKLQNTLLLIYMSLNKNSFFIVLSLGTGGDKECKKERGAMLQRA